MRLEIGSFDEFVRFFFEYGAELFQNDEIEEPDLLYQPREVAQFYRRLFLEPGIVAERYARAMLDRGFGAMIDCNIPIYITDLIWTSTIPRSEREDLIRSMVSLYREFFDRDPLLETPFMWWDVISYDFECGNHSREESDEARALQDCMFETLLEILALPTDASQQAALHGLGHLHHPGTVEAIQTYLAQHPDLSHDLAAYARRCAIGLV